MNKTSCYKQKDLNSFDCLGLSCLEEQFLHLVPVPISEYIDNLKETIQRLELTSKKRVLILRTANIHLVEALLSVLTDTVPDIEIDLVTQQVFVPHIKHSQVTPILIPDGPINEKILAGVLKQKDQSQYQLALLPFSNAGRGYENVIRAVHTSFLGRVRGIAANGQLRKIYRHPRLISTLQIPWSAALFLLMLVVLTGMAFWFKGWLPAKRKVKKICFQG